MKIRLNIRKGDTRLYQGDYEIIDAESFGAAFAGAWNDMQARRLGKASSVGDLMDKISDSELEELDGAEFVLRKL